MGSLKSTGNWFFPQLFYVCIYRQIENWRFFHKLCNNQPLQYKSSICLFSHFLWEFNIMKTFFTLFWRAWLWVLIVGLSQTIDCNRKGVCINVEEFLFLIKLSFQCLRDNIIHGRHWLLNDGTKNFKSTQKKKKFTPWPIKRLSKSDNKHWMMIVVKFIFICSCSLDERRRRFW